MASKRARTNYIPGSHRQTMARQRVLPPEINHLDTQLVSASIDSAAPTELIVQTLAGVNLDHLTHIDRGDADDQRVGSKLKGLTLQARLQFITDLETGSQMHVMTPVTTGPSPLTYTGGFNDRKVDIWIVRNKNPRGVAPSAGNIWEASGLLINECFLRKHDQASEFSILAHKQVKINMHNRHFYDSTNNKVVASRAEEYCEMFLQLPDDMITTYRDAASGAIANCVENSLHIFATLSGGPSAVNTNNLPVSVSGKLRLRFLDI